MNPSCVLVAARRGCAQISRPPPGVEFVFPSKCLQVRRCSQSGQSVPAARLPYRVKVAAGKRYSWCACGHSKKQPFCDGAHKTKAPGISPLRFTPDSSRMVMLCACKETKNAPFCDGSHFKVIFRDLVKSVRGVFK
ncbi:CDGSH iron-sulfur domain-containing protein 3, mitochondrial-like isoform X3 [Antennarius striatus]|uniref:CDGSH iron-sulfur domain-containing protein 3, mitochondrial-like isoform X3 n=1 Tax=Antennarius striatus TaxID=241820 RepID=UPI0035B3542E